MTSELYPLASGLAHFAHDSPVAAVDIVAEDRGAVAAGCHRAVGDVEGYRVGKSVMRLLAVIDDLAHAVLAEAATAAEDLLGEVERVLQPDAAVAEIAAAFGEQPAAGRVVHVDPVAVGKRKEDVAQRIAGAGLLADAIGERLGLDLAPVDSGGVELGIIVPVLEDLEAGGRQRVGIAAQHGQIFLA